MKKLSVFIALLCSTALLSACGNKTVTGKEGMLEFAKEYYGDESLTLSDTLNNDNQELAWFVSGKAPDELCYAAAFSVEGDGEYKFIADQTAAQNTPDIWTCLWYGTISFHIENPECTEIKIVSSQGVEKIPVDTIPCSTYFSHEDTSGLDYYFLDKEGNEITD